ncbi:endothelin-converting enzyme 2-like [Rhipicephalus microplus]|uniref:endothelin-converting enzyme 2-like n=1 Tax=Rhipicephalus microplus TaxID=6941 RepID=UPI003F6CBCE3
MATARQEGAPRRASRTSTTTTATSRAVPGTHRSSIAVPKATGQQDPVPRRDSRAAPATKATNPKVPQTHRPSVAVPKMTSRERDKEMTRMTEDMNDNKATTAQKKASALKEQPYSDKTSPPKKDGDAHGSRYATKAVYRFYTYATVAAASAVIFALVYAAFWMLRGRVTNDGVQCRTKECKEAAEYLKNLTVAAYTPCSDFYDRVCGTWTAPGAGFQVDLLKDLLRTLNASMFETRVPQDAESQRLGMHVLLPLYRGCYRYMQHVSNIRDEVANTEAAVNVNEVRRATSFSDIVRFVVRTSLQLGFYTIFDVRFVHEGDRDMLELRRGYSLQAKVGSQGASDAKFRISKLVSSWLGIDNATKETELLFRIDAKVQTAFAQHLPESRSTLRDVTEGLLTLSADEWVKAINDAHNVTALKIQASDSVIDTNMASVRRVGEYLPAEGVNATAFYIATNLVADVIFVVYTKLDSSTSPLHRVSFCVYLVRTCFAATWPLLASKVLGDKTSMPALERIFTGLQQAAKTPQALTWMDDKEREVASAIVSNTSLLVVSSTMPTVSKPDYTGPAGSLFQDDPDAFLLTYARARRHHYNVMLHSPPARTDLLMSDMEQGGQIAYLPLLKSLFVPTLPQRAPFLYAVGVPDRYNYGTVGGLLATKLIDVIVKNERTWNEVSKTKQAKVMACLFGKHNHLGFGEKARGDIAAQQAMMLSLSAGARLAYAAMEADFRERVGGNEELAQKWWPDVQETFFMRFCLTWCSSIRAPVPLTYEEMCLLPLYNMKEFGARYGCKSNSTYSAGPMCDV